jgi:tetratricopeptide (TPR) repeat protein
VKQGVGVMNSIEDLERKLDQLLNEPDNSQLLNGIGVCLYQVKDWKNAEMYLQRAYELDPHNQDILYNYALLLYLQSQWQRAISIYQACLELFPDDRGVMENMGNSYYQLGEYESAARMYEQLQTCRKENV